MKALVEKIPQQADMMDSGRLLQQLRQHIEPSRILTRPIDRIAFASDASFYHLVPEIVVQPTTVEEVRVLFQLCRENHIPLTFRAGGTSLSGQSITDGVLVDIGRYWRRIKVEENGRAIRLQPGVIGEQANNALKLYSVKIGPDPASIGSCRIGGILSNNASGMCCGVSQNAYHTLRSLRFLLPSGTEVDTAEPDADEKFRRMEPSLAAGLLELKSEIEQNQQLRQKISAKYRMKNTTGYGLNAFLDYERPVDIFSHLLIGAEGTLAFIAETVLDTVPDLPVKYTGLLLFPNLHAACAAIVPLREAGAATLELMDRASLRSVEDHPGVPSQIRQLPEGAAGLLVEFQAKQMAASQENAIRAKASVAGLNLLMDPLFTDDPVVQAQLWKIRKGMFPSVGAVRARGTTAIIEDVAFPIEHLANAAVDLTALFEKHGYRNAIIFGHAKDGNLHFVITQGFGDSSSIEQYSHFIDDVVSLVVKKYDGALKAEHGTGRNMAPFVETEWGKDAYGIMLRLKKLADPQDILNPGVILNSDPQAHLNNLKKLPVVEDEVDKCIECGFCEPKCPSRDLTLTPRQRIVVRRELQRLSDSGAFQQHDALNNDFPYMALDTCAVDGMCATNCPVNIDTGKLVKHFRQLRHTAQANNVAVFLAKHMRYVESGARLALWSGHLVQSIFGPKAMTAITEVLDTAAHKWMGEPFWKWSAEMPRPQKGSVPQSSERAGAQALYFPSCISRIMGALPGEPQEVSIMQAMLDVAERAGVSLYIPEDLAGNCCGVPFSSKGFEQAHHRAVNRTIEHLWEWSGRGEIPIVFDTSPCAYGLKSSRDALMLANQKRFDGMTILDSIEFVHDVLLPKLAIHRKVHSVALHPVCSAVKMGIAPKLKTIAQACSESALVPDDAGCCGFAGDRGFLLPELTRSATTIEAAALPDQVQDGYYSSSRTCEIGMTRATGKIYRSYLHLLHYSTQAETR
jgi:D-lactate dehydrogenase